jgi:hypothetical protein
MMKCEAEDFGLKTSGSIARFLDVTFESVGRVALRSEIIERPCRSSALNASALNFVGSQSSNAQPPSAQSSSVSTFDSSI